MPAKLSKSSTSSTPSEIPEFIAHVCPVEVEGSARRPRAPRLLCDRRLACLDERRDSGALEACLLCCKEHPKYAAVGRCGHAEVCWLCAVRMREQLKDVRCPVCKEELQEVLLTDDVAKGSELLKSGNTSRLPRDAARGLLFADAQVKLEVERLFDYACWLHDCRQIGATFPTLKALEKHLWEEHDRQFCHTCLRGRQVFLHEQLLYTKEDHGRHAREGDGPHILGKFLPSLPRHAHCEFCKKDYYSYDHLLEHMNRRHHLCKLCERSGNRGEFYRDYGYLSAHYEEKHYVCKHEDCRQGPYHLTVFPNEGDLQIHEATEHTRGKAGKRQGGRLITVMGAASYRDEQDRRRLGGGTAAGSRPPGPGPNSRGDANGGNNNNQQRDSEYLVHFAWPQRQSKRPARATEDEALAQFGENEKSEDESALYPPRQTRRSASSLQSTALEWVAQADLPTIPPEAKAKATAIGPPMGRTAAANPYLQTQTQTQRQTAPSAPARAPPGPKAAPTPAATISTNNNNTNNNNNNYNSNNNGSASGPRQMTLSDFAPATRKAKAPGPPPGAMLLSAALKKIQSKGIDTVQGLDLPKYRERNRKFRLDLESSCGSEDLATFKEISATFRRKMVALQDQTSDEWRDEIQAYGQQVLTWFEDLSAKIGDGPAAELFCDLVVLLPDKHIRQALHRELTDVNAQFQELSTGGRKSGPAKGRGNKR